MCVVSMVFDHFNPLFPPSTLPLPAPAQDWTLTPHPDPNVELRRLITEFREAVAAAKTVDRLTAQPDCEDPEKAKIEERVAALERRLDAMAAGAAR